MLRDEQDIDKTNFQKLKGETNALFSIQIIAALLVKP